MTKRILPLLLGILTTGSISAQRFQPGTFTFSGKKIAYITMEDGSQIQGEVKDLDRKKGLIKEVKVKTSGKKQKLKPANIKFMYLPPSGWDKLGKTLDFLSDAQQWDAVDLDKDIIGKGYVYFEKVPVRIKKKIRPMMMQLINPSFSGKTKVYFDPMAKETASLGVGGLTLAGGNEKSYYVRKGDAPAFRLYKKDYDKQFQPLFGDCPLLAEQYGKNPKWSDLEAHVYRYAKECK
jgi:hypothetical protein